MTQFPTSHLWLVHLGLSFIAAAALVPQLGAQYGEKALRPNLSPEPYFRTEDGRQNKRNADALVNRYRLYDFYRRQADYSLSQPGAEAALLPPFPELDGGRRGHWGATNEVETTALPRKTAPSFTTVTSRRSDGDLYLRQGTGVDGSVIVIGTRQPGLRGAYASARMSVPRHSFSTEVDRFGMNLALSGQSLWQETKNEWTSEGQQATWFGGYHVHGDHSVLVWEIDQARVLEVPAMLSGRDDFNALARKFEFLSSATEELSFTLPLPAGIKLGTKAVCTVTQADDGAMLAHLEFGQQIVLHRIDAADGLEFHIQPDGSGLKLHRSPAGGRLQILSWAGKIDSIAGAEKELRENAMEFSAARPSSFTKGGPSRFGEEIKVAGILNADPEARGGAYEIDDIPVPGDAPPFAAMTLSGLAFAENGAAYACTLVGDLWKITGLQGDLREVRWKRYAAGLNLPLGVQVVNGVPYVTTIPNVLRLTDLNGDGEADFYERLSREAISAAGQNGRDLQRDAAGNFYTATGGGGIWKISSDGTRIERIGEGSRNPLGLAARADGLVISDSSEGDAENGTCTLFEATHSDNSATVDKRHRLLYLPRGVDNSPGSRIFLNEPRFGPLGESLIGLSYGTGTWYAILRDVVDGTPQAAMIPQRGQFLSGASRLALQPLDGQVFVTGLDGWGDYAIAEGCLHRIRYTGRTVNGVQNWRAHRNGIRLDFRAPLAPGQIKPETVFVQQWNYVDSAKTYGSMEMSVKEPEKPGHDRLKIRRVIPSADRKSIFIEVPELLPAMCTQVRAIFLDKNGGKVDVDLYATLQKLAPEPPGTAPVAADRPSILAAPTVVSNGDTYQKTIEHFDRLAGRESIQRPMTTEVEFKPADLSYAWIKEHLLTSSCLICHGAGTQHDYTTYQGLKAKVRLEAPEKSALLGMLQTGSMPPYPLPTISPSMQKAVLEWIRRGAPE